MRLAWARHEFDGIGTAKCRACGGTCHGEWCGYHRHTLANRHAGAGPRIGPRVRLPQAKDVPEHVLLAVFRTNPLTFFTQHENKRVPSLLDAAPELRAFPRKVLLEKLKALKRRGFVDGCACGCHGDWHLKGGASWR